MGRFKDFRERQGRRREFRKRKDELALIQQKTGWSKKEIVNKAVDLSLTRLQQLTEQILTDDSFDSSSVQLHDPVLQHSWVEIALDIITNNLTRTRFQILSKKEIEILRGPVYNLFHHTNDDFNAPSFWPTLWMWFTLERDIFIWFGPDYGAGLPSEMYVLNPRLMWFVENREEWWYNDPHTGASFTIPEHQLIHIWKPNIWLDYRGVSILWSMFYELRQDLAANTANLKSLEKGAIPDGVLSTEQKISPQQADEISDSWEKRYGVRSARQKRIAVLGMGSKFQALNEDLIKYLELKPENRTTILTKFGIPLKVANANTEKTALSGKDSNEQYKALWSQTLIPTLRYVTRELNEKFFGRFGLDFHANFDLTDIPELQEDEADLHDRLRKDVEFGLITPNEARELLNREAKPGGDDLRYKGTILDGNEDASSDEPEEEEEEGVDDTETEDKYIDKIVRLYG